MSKHILITGGAGFVGSTIATGFKKKYPKYTVYAFDSLKRRGSELNLNRLKDAGVNFIHGDIRNAEDLKEFTHLDLIVDASADPSVLSGIQSPVYPLINANLFGTVNCLELADKHKAAFIFLSTSRVYPIKNLEAAAFEELDTRFVWSDKQLLRGISSKGVQEDFPMDGSRSFYGATKLGSELMITEYNELKGIQTVINRCGVISGPWQMGKVDQGVLVLWLARHYFKGELSYIGYGGTGKQMRDVMHADDLFDLIDHQTHHLQLYNGKTLNVGGGNKVSFSLLELTALCEQITGNKLPIKSIKENRVADVRIYMSDCSQLQALTPQSGWEPKKNMEMLVSDTFEWMKKNEKELKYILG
ncbi:MAG: NAD-dependent epimerase/dehydratase family protein [Bacteroidia bacterium]|nr:NAD-dependent epimerase/dehydratase family protein [Bacteroidia bacterium]